ncbi:unnamed protein product [Tilletia laevis]|uniref:PSP1 C-terminal domain-containing protein n=3 Tax=Tilletia TaxID=13289 RepID=A0A9N8QFN5_9BASI|nr:hypothetical protein CF336_g7988 [Tilletia laevis]KAE8245625.1 hypothetical protein A4X03_0g7469 [Tilletia caries]KAE8186233.1 hypothetical protein CF335_g7502 [Tilletia laevis]CAD6884933.1 unnamed protein product [Tilletia caries]CAD6930035.1 unnamed protein product [Tilletia laevis]
MNGSSSSSSSIPMGGSNFDHHEHFPRGRLTHTHSSTSTSTSTSHGGDGGSPFSAHSRESSLGNQPQTQQHRPRDHSPFQDSAAINMQHPQRAIGFEVGRATGNGHHPASSSSPGGGGDFSSRASSLGPVARPQPAGPAGTSMPRTTSAIGPSGSSQHISSSAYGSSSSSSSSSSLASSGFGGFGGSGSSSALGSLAITDEDLLGDLESLNIGSNGGPYGHGSASTSSVLARVQYDTAQIQRHPSVRVPSNHAAQTGVHAASVPSGFGLGQLFANHHQQSQHHHHHHHHHSSSSALGGGGGNGSVYGSSAGSNSSSSYGGAHAIPAEMSASTNSHLFHRSNQQHQYSPQLSHHHHVSSTGSNSSAAAAAAAEYLRGGTPYGSGSHPTQQQQSNLFSQHQHQLYGHSHAHAHHPHAHPLSASWNDSGAVTPGTSAPPAPGARMHELAERLQRHQQVQGQQSYLPLKSKHVPMPSRDLGGASWGTSGSPTALGGLGSSPGAAAAAAAAMAAALGRSPASTSGLGRRVVPRSGSQTSPSRRSLGGGGGGGSDFDAQSSHSESDWVDDDGPEDGPEYSGPHGNGGLGHYGHHHHHQHAHQQYQNGMGLQGYQHQQQAEGGRGHGHGEEYEEGEEGMGGAGARTPTARTSRHPFNGFTSMSGRASQQQQHQQQAPPPLPLHSLDALAAHGLDELTIATLAALGASGAAGAADLMGAFGGQGGGHGGQGGGMIPGGSSSFGMHPGGPFGGPQSFGPGGGGGHPHQQGPGGPTGFAGPGVAELGKGVPLQTLLKETPLYIVEFKQGRKEVFFAPVDLQMQWERERERIVNGDLVIVEADRGKDLGTVVTDSLTVEQVQAYLLHHSEVLQAQVNAQQRAEGGAGAGGPLSPGLDGTNGTSSSNGGGPHPPGSTNPNSSSSSSNELPMYARLARSIHPKRLYGKASTNDTSLLLTKAQDEERALQLCRTKVSQRGLPMSVVAAEMQWDRRKLTFYYTASARVDFRDLVKELFRLYKTRIWMCHLAR